MAGCGEEVQVAPGKELQRRDGLRYLPNEESPFTGQAVWWYEDGQESAVSHWQRE